MAHGPTGAGAPDRVFEMYRHRVPAAGLRAFWTGMRFLVASYAVVFVLLVICLTIGVPAWVTALLVFVAFVGLALFFAFRPVWRSTPPM